MAVSLTLCRNVDKYTFTASYPKIPPRNVYGVVHGPAGAVRGQILTYLTITPVFYPTLTLVPTPHSTSDFSSLRLPLPAPPPSPRPAPHRPCLGRATMKGSGPPVHDHPSPPFLQPPSPSSVPPSRPDISPSSNSTVSPTVSSAVPLSSSSPPVHTSPALISLSHPLPSISSNRSPTLASPGVEHPTADTTARLLAVASAASAARDKLIVEIEQLRQELVAEHDHRTRRQRDAAAVVERAAKALAVRALEIDNRALHVAHREASVTAAQRRLDQWCSERSLSADRERAVLAERETALITREASLRYSAVEQARLHDWSRQLETREARISDAESAERERIAQRIAAVAKREVVVAERERRVDTAFQEREAELAKQQAAVQTLRDKVLRERSEMLLQIESERAAFWAHQQKLSGVVAAETETLLAQQARLKWEYERDAAVAKRALKEMTDTLTQLRAEVDSRTEQRTDGKLASALADLNISHTILQSRESSEKRAHAPADEISPNPEPD